MSDLIRDTDLADEFGIDVARLHRLRREKKWPHVKFSRHDIRFTEDQRQQIIAMQTVGGRTSKGQTARSAARGQA